MTKSIGNVARVGLEVLERAVVIVAAVAALFPLWQWYEERDDRQLDRVANLALSGEACDAWISNPAPAPIIGVEDSELLELERNKLAILRKAQLDNYNQSMSVICLQVLSVIWDDDAIQGLLSSIYRPELTISDKLKTD